MDMKKGIALLLMLAMLLCAATALADAPVWIGNIMLENGQYITSKYSAPQTGTPASSEYSYAYYKDGGLKLKNFKYTNYTQALQYSAGIYAQDNLSVTVEGNNEIKVPGRGIVVEKEGGSLTVSGTGNLTVVSGYECLLANGDVSLNAANIVVRNSKVNSSMGISAEYGSVTIQNNAKVQIEASGYGLSARYGIKIDTANLDVTSRYSSGIWTVLNDLEFKNCTIISRAETEGHYKHDYHQAVSYRECNELKLGPGMQIWGRIDPNAEGELQLIDTDVRETLKAMDYVEIKPNQNKYTVTVVNGVVNLSGNASSAERTSNEYRAGQKVYADADDPASGKVFSHWEGADGLFFTDSKYDENQDVIFFYVPEGGVTLTACYKDAAHICGPLTLNHDLTKHWYECPQGCVSGEATHAYGADGKCTAVGCDARKPEVKPDAPKPLYPIILTKVLVGVKPEDLPDGTEFIFDICDMGSVNGEYAPVVGRVAIPKEHLEGNNGMVRKPIHVPPKFAIIERHPGCEDIFDLNISYKMTGAVGNLVGQNLPSGGGESTPVGSFAITEMVIDPSFPPPQINSYRIRSALEVPEIAVPEIVITNDLTILPANLPQTGDESGMLLWLSLALSSLAALALIARKKREA